MPFSLIIRSKKNVTDILFSVHEILRRYAISATVNLPIASENATTVLVKRKLNYSFIFQFIKTAHTATTLRATYFFWGTYLAHSCTTLRSQNDRLYAPNRKEQSMIPSQCSLFTKSGMVSVAVSKTCVRRGSVQPSMNIVLLGYMIISTNVICY